MVKPSCPSAFTAPVFPPSNSLGARRWPVANSYAAPKMAFGGYRRSSHTSSYVAAGAKPCSEKNPSGPSRSYSCSACTTSARVTPSHFTVIGSSIGSFRSVASAFAPSQSRLGRPVRWGTWAGLGCLRVLVTSSQDAAVDDPDGASDPAGGWGEQERDDVGQVAGRADPAERMEAVAAVQGLLKLVLGDKAFVDGGGDDGRGNDVDPDLALGQREVIESRRIAERDQDGAAILRRMGTVSRQRLDIPFCPRRIGDALVDELTLKDIRRFCCVLVQMSCNLAPRLHSQEDHGRTQGLITV